MEGPPEPQQLLQHTAPTRSSTAAQGATVGFLMHCGTAGTPNLVFYLFVFFILSGAHPRHMEVPRGQIEAVATGLHRIIHLHHSSGQCRILNPLSEARDATCVLMDVRFISAEPGRQLPHLVF